MNLKRYQSPRRCAVPTPGRTRKLTGISLEPLVADYLDGLATNMRANRSFVVNSIVHEYARIVEGVDITGSGRAVRP